MTYNNQPSQGYPYQQPQQPVYPPAPPAYPQQQQQFAPPQQPYPPQFQQPAPQFAPQAPVAPPVQGTLDDYYSQPSVGSGASWSFKGKPVGTRYVGIVAREVTNADVRQQTDPISQQPVNYRDGTPKFVMVCPMLCQPDQEHPDGKADWYVGGQARDELKRAMAEAGAPEGPPEAGALVAVTLTGRRPGKNPALNPSNQLQVQYQRPQGAAPVQQAPNVNDALVQPEHNAVAPGPWVQQPVANIAGAFGGQVQGQPQMAPQPPVQQMQVPTELAGQGGVLVQPDHNAVAPGPWVQQPAPQMAPTNPPVQQPAPTQFAQPGQMPTLSDEQQALLARLTAGPQPTQQ